jgi:RNA polymerase sigma-70 factor, ECF subfamily
VSASSEPGGAIDTVDESAVLSAARSGDHTAFAILAERYRHQLHVHCYRMLGSFDQAEDLVQETMLRAWRGLGGFEGRSLFRTWLYRIATNLCLNTLERAAPRVLPQDVVPAVTESTPRAEARASPPQGADVPWLEPYPDELLDLAAAGADARLIARENVAVAFVAALQHLPPKQRAILLLADVVGWSAAEIAELLDVTVASVTSALQRAHATMPARTMGMEVTAEERAVLQRFMDAWESGDASVLTALLRDDARWAMPPAPLWFDGRVAIENLLTLFPPHWNGRAFRMVATAANRQPAAAAYLRPAGDSEFRLSGVHVLAIEAGKITAITTFGTELCAGLALAPTV